jgi:putative ABC transport system substrate-binding protein
MKLATQLPAYAMSDEQRARKNALDNRQRTAVKKAGMGTRNIVVLLVGLVLASVHSAESQQPTKKVSRIGILAAQSSSAASYRVEAFRKGLIELGYTEGKNIAIEHRYADGRLERLPDLAAQVIRLNVDVILALGTPAALAAKKATMTIPIVMTGGDPVRAGIVASLARPGGNVTGLSDATVDVSTKRLELLKEVVPNFPESPSCGIHSIPQIHFS